MERENRTMFGLFFIDLLFLASKLPSPPHMAKIVHICFPTELPRFTLGSHLPLMSGG